MHLRYLILILVLLLGLLTVQCLFLNSRRETSVHAVSKDALRPPTSFSARFIDSTDAAGLRYVWSLPGKTPRNILQTIGNGCAFLDYNNDGNLDILLVGSKLALYQGDGHGHFTDVTKATGLDRFQGDYLGCAVGDYDNDGYDDLYISGYRTGLLLHNEIRVRRPALGDKHRGQLPASEQTARTAGAASPNARFFRDVTRQSGIRTDSWSTSAAWGDMDGDGRLDLYVCNYVEFRPEHANLCLFNGVQSACGPLYYHPESGVLYHNEGDGTFTDVTHRWGLECPYGRALGAAFADLEGVGRQSLFVASDQAPSSLFLNTGARCTNIGRTSGAATLEDGHAFAGMGVDWGDYDNDGMLDLVVMDFAGEDKRILHNEGAALFLNRSQSLGLHPDSFPLVSFGTKWLDYDNDGWLDLIIASGHTADNIEAMLPTQRFLQPTLLYHNAHGKQFENASVGLIGPAGRGIIGRGLAIGDYDNDGKVDVLIVDSAGKPLLLHNETPRAGHWLTIKLVGTKSNRDGFGALLTARVENRNLLRQCQSDGSYLSASDSRVHFGLATAPAVAVLTVRWPSGRIERFHDIPADRNITLVEGEGKVRGPAPTYRILNRSTGD